MGSKVQIIKVSPRPSGRHLLREDGTWYAPQVQITPWTRVYRTPALSYCWPDGTPAIIPDPMGRKPVVIDIENPPGNAIGFFVTDQHKWVTQSDWKARDFRIAQYQKAIADIEKKSEHVEIVAPTLTALKKQLEALQGTFTVPELISAEPPLEPLVFPNPETAPFSKIPVPAKRLLRSRYPNHPRDNSQLSNMPLTKVGAYLNRSFNT